MAKQFTTMDIMDIYAKKLLKETKQAIYEDGMKITRPVLTKATMKAFFDDIEMVPTTFQLDFYFNIIFDSQKIREEFSGEDIEAEPETLEPEPDDETEKQIQKAMSAETPGKSVRSSYVNYEKFFWDVVRKKLSPNGVENKLRELARAGVIKLQDFSIDNVSESTDSDVKQIFRAFVDQDRKNRQANPISLRYGYSITFAAKNEVRQYSKKECFAVIIEFAPKFEQSILAKTEFYDFDKKVPTPKNGGSGKQL